MSTDVQPSRDPPSYRPTVHFLERLRDDYDDYNRHLDGDIIEACIRHGEVARGGRHEFHFYEDVDGVTYKLVVNTRRGVVVTGHPDAIDVEAAKASGRWSTAQIEDICEFLAAK